MTVYRINPLTDERWSELLAHNPAASVFHTAAWLEALHLTYGYDVFAFTSSAPADPLTNAIPFCQVPDVLGRRRLVSLPFSDHCAPLVENAEQLSCLLGFVQRRRREEKWKSIELRGVAALPRENGFCRDRVFHHHKLDLRPSLDEIFKKFHRNCVQRKIERATREGLTYRHGRSSLQLSQFYDLLVQTRRRHGVPPQPISWFRNLIGSLKDNLTIHVALKDEQPVSSIITLRHNNVLLYKYGCSNKSLSHLGGTQMLFWNAIVDAKRHQISEMDLGRSDYDAAGLVTFKERLGANRTALVYSDFPAVRQTRPSKSNMLRKRIVATMPDGLLAVTGSLLYRYMG